MILSRVENTIIYQLNVKITGTYFIQHTYISG